MTGKRMITYGLVVIAMISLLISGASQRGEYFQPLRVGLFFTLLACCSELMLMNDILRLKNSSI